MGRTMWLCSLALALLLGAPARALDKQSDHTLEASSWTPSPDWRCEQDLFDVARQMVCWERQLLTSGISQQFSPALELRETKDGFVVTADVPGLGEKDLEVTLNGNRFAIRGQRPEVKPAAGEKYYTRERAFGSFERSFTLPEMADGDRIDAKVDKGVLTLRIPKKASQESKRITVRGSSGSELPMLGQNR